MVEEPPLSKRVDQGNTPINIICRLDMVTLVHSGHFQVLRSFLTILYSI